MAKIGIRFAVYTDLELWWKFFTPLSFTHLMIQDPEKVEKFLKSKGIEFKCPPIPEGEHAIVLRIFEIDLTEKGKCTLVYKVYPMFKSRVKILGPAPEWMEKSHTQRKGHRFYRGLYNYKVKKNEKN